MNTDPKIIILCNNPIAIPGIREFLFYGKVGAFVVTKRNKEMQHLLTQMVGDAPVPVIIVNRKNYIEKIITAIDENEINTGFIMTFPYILPKEVWSLPQKGFINFHFGLLPQCRGPQPVLWHLLNNDKEAGVTVHKIDDGIDTGEIIIQEKTNIADDDTYGTLQTKLAYLAAKAAATLLKILSYGSFIPSTKQDESKAAYYEMPGAKELTINWAEMSAAQILRLVNACNPWNKGAGTIINEWVIGITEVEIIEMNESITNAPGTIVECSKEKGLLVATSDNKTLSINIIFTNEGFFSGGKMMSFGLQKGMRFN
jgi:methionyl-tRNA formyltransferase